LFVVQNITKAPLSAIIRDLMPFLYALFAALAIVTFVPDLVLFLPRLLGYQG
jgi:TRAP-type C4-dicarboxylate transport system permease large subunit